MAIEGPLRELALSDLLQMLEQSCKTGVLTVRSDGLPHPAAIRFERGSVVGAELPDRLGRLGNALVKAGKLTESQMEQALSEQQSGPRRRFGSILIEKGWVSEEDVRRSLQFQIQETICELVRWQSGYFRFEEVSEPDAGHVEVRLSVQSLLMEAMRRIDEWSAIESRIPSLDVVPRLITDADEEHQPDLDLTPEEWEFLGCADGSRTLRTIAEELARSEFDVAKTAYALSTTGVVEITRNGGRTKSGSQPATPVPERLAAVERQLRSGALPAARNSIRKLLQQHPDAAEVYVLAGHAAGAVNAWAEARNAFLRAVQQNPLCASAHYHLGFAAARLGELGRAEEAWATYLRLESSVPGRWETATRGIETAGALRRLLDEERA